ncbi:MAG: Spo0B domain-containing protein [Clostridiales bacterium]|nr:Spo0B domain-containing protein [Clostridiales bacterium]MDD7367101.1 Spo0B domain-containing protein [Clostridiales bacterium]MDY2873244.1 Spo0B domain-containing protein [Eubacteriales bacterium]
MTRPMRRFVNLKKAVIYTVVINMLQIAGSITVAVMSLITGGHAFIGLPEQVLLCTMTLLVSWGAVLDIREAFSARELASDADMLQDAYAQLEDLNGTLRAQRHDFMNHLQVVFSLLELEDYKEASDYIERVYGDIRRVSRTLKTAHPAINALLAAKVGDCEARGVHVDLQIESPWAGLPVESWEMCRVLGNLIDNAMDAMKDAPEPRLLIRLSESVQSYTFVIANNGPMIQPSIAERIFQRGFSTKGEGRGMGLSIVRGIMESGGGRLTLASDERETRFEGTLPKTIAAPQALAESERART